MPKQRERAGPGSVPRGTKVGLTPSAARHGSRRLGQPDQQPRVRPGAERAACGGGDEPRHPSPRRAPRDLLIKISTHSRRWSASYLCATAAANPPAPATPRHRTNDSSPAALKIPDKESRNSRFPTSQSLDPASAPPPVAAVAAAAAASNSLHLETARDRPPRPPRDRARAPGTLAQRARLSQFLLGAPRPLLGQEAGALRPIPRRRGERAHSLVPSQPRAAGRAHSRTSK